MIKLEYIIRLMKNVILYILSNERFVKYLNLYNGLLIMCDEKSH